MTGNPSRYERTRCYRRSWVFERTGWVVMLAVTIAALLGVFGDGWLSRAEARAGTLTVHYARFARAHAPLDLVVEWTPEQGETDLWVARGYLDGFAIESVLPAFTETVADSGRVYYRFQTRTPQERLSVRFTLKPERAGRFMGELGADDGQAIVIRQLIFP